MNNLYELVSKSARLNGLNSRFLSVVSRLFRVETVARRRRTSRQSELAGCPRVTALHYSSRYLFGLTSATGSKSTFQIWVRTACPPPSRIPLLCLALQFVILSDMERSGRRSTNNLGPVSISASLDGMEEPIYLFDIENIHWCTFEYIHMALI